MFLEHKMLLNTKGPVPEEEYTLPFGQASVVRKGGKGCRVTVVALALMVRKTAGSL